MTHSGVPTERQLREMISDAVSPDAGLRVMTGFDLDVSANRGFRKVFFSRRCTCGTAALLSVEVAEGKTTDQIRAVLPSLVGHLEGQARAFAGLPCDAHKRMRLGARQEP